MLFSFVSTSFLSLQTWQFLYLYKIILCKNSQYSNNSLTSIINNYRIKYLTRHPTGCMSIRRFIVLEGTYNGIYGHFCRYENSISFANGSITPHVGLVMADIKAQLSLALYIKTSKCLDLWNYKFVDVEPRFTLTKSEVSSTILKSFHAILSHYSPFPPHTIPYILQIDNGQLFGGLIRDDRCFPLIQYRLERVISPLTIPECCHSQLLEKQRHLDVMLIGCSSTIVMNRN